MNLTEYAHYDALGLAELVAKKQVSPKELALTAAKGHRNRQPHRQRRGRDLSRPHRGPRRNHARQRPVPRRAAAHQGRVRPREGPQDRVRQPLVQGHGGRSRHLSGRPAQGVRRQHHGPLGRAGIFHVRLDRERDVRQHVEPLEERLFGRRLLRRRAGGRHLRHGADRARLRHRRLDPHPGQPVRRRRPETVARARLDRPGGGRGRLRLLDEFHPGQDRARRRRHARLPGAPAARRSLHHSQARRALCAARRQTCTEAQDRHGAQRAGRREGRSRGGEGGRGGGQGARGHGPHGRAGAAPTWAAKAR